MISRVLVAEQDADRIAVWRADPISGQLAREQDYSLAGGPAPMALDPAGGWIIVGLRAQPGLALVRLDAHGLPLPEPSRIDLPQDPCYVSVDRTGRFVLSAYYAAGCCAVHRISGEGNLEPDAVQWIQAEPHAHCIQTDPANEYAYLPQTRPADRIQQFHFDAENGSLAALSTPLATIEPGQGPRHYCYHAALGCVFVSNEDGSSVSALVQDSGTGHLSLRGTWSTLPAWARGSSSRCSAPGAASGSAASSSEA